MSSVNYKVPIRGWLILFGLGLFLSLIGGLLSLLGLPQIYHAFSTRLASPECKPILSLLAETYRWCMVMILANTVAVAFQLVLFFGRSRFFPNVTIFLIAIQLLSGAVFYSHLNESLPLLLNTLAAASHHAATTSTYSASHGATMLPKFLISLAWIFYFLRSQRVQETFTH